jgi:hypothetical protein
VRIGRDRLGVPSADAIGGEEQAVRLENVLPEASAA